MRIFRRNRYKEQTFFNQEGKAIGFRGKIVASAHREYSDYFIYETEDKRYILLIENPDYQGDYLEAIGKSEEELRKKIDECASGSIIFKRE